MRAHFCVLEGFLTDSELLKDLPGENKELEAIMVDPNPYKGISRNFRSGPSIDPSKRNQKK